MSDLLQLYQDIILNHNKRPLNYGELDGHTGKAQAHNPLCGDNVTVYWKSVDDILTGITFEAQGCAISRASASIMTGLLNGKSSEEIKDLFSKLLGFLLDPDSEATMDEQLGDLVALSGVRKYPARIKCATLAWHALVDNVSKASGGE
ncbi:MAG: SUF system NifU family Fe-S cluster assembly protein [Verrucomicrobia bacterium]|nr:SUF system NifU family Fe-S cluster assembly protein [Verrucomicrobiota bacterium]